MPKCYHVNVAFTEDSKGLSVVGRTPAFVYIVSRNAKTGNIKEEVVGECRNLQVHPVHADVKNTFNLFNQMFEFDGDTEES